MMMIPRFLLTLLAMMVTTAALAQQAPAPVPPQAPVTIVGTTAQVEGLVTVSFGSNVASVVNESPIIDKSRYVTSSTGRATLRFRDGCVVALGPNQWFEVDSSTDCPTRIAAVRTLSDTELAALLPSDAKQLMTVAALIGLAGVVANRADRRITP